MSRQLARLARIARIAATESAAPKPAATLACTVPLRAIRIGSDKADKATRAAPCRPCQIRFEWPSGARYMPAWQPALVLHSPLPQSSRFLQAWRAGGSSGRLERAHPRAGHAACHWSAGAGPVQLVIGGGFDVQVEQEVWVSRPKAFGLLYLPATRCGRSIRLGRHGLRMKGGEVGVDLSYGGGTLADAGRHPLHRSTPHVSDRKNTGAAGCQWQLWIAPGGDEALVVQADTPIEPLRAGIGADEQEHVLCVDP